MDRQPDFPPATPRRRPGAAKRILPPNPLTAGAVAVFFVVLLYLVELIDVVLPLDLDDNGILARSPTGLDGIVWAPLLHVGWGHLIANTVPVLVFAFLAMAGGLVRWAAVTAAIWVVAGLGVWLTAPPGTVTLGASGLAFGWLTFLLVRGVFTRGIGQLVLAAVLFVIWGGMLWGVLPGHPGVSWQGHLFGALGGVLAAWLVARGDRPKVRTGTGSLGA